MKEEKKITRLQIRNAATILLNKYGWDIRKLDVKIAILFTPFKGFKADRIVNRIWYQIKKVAKQNRQTYE